MKNNVYIGKPQFYYIKVEFFVCLFFLSESVFVLEVKFSIYLNRHVS